MKKMLCVVAILAGLVASVASAGLTEDMAALRAIYTTGWNLPDVSAAYVAKANEILAAYPDMTKEQKNELYTAVGIMFWGVAGDKTRAVEWFGKVLTNTSTAAANYDTRRRAKWMQGVCTVNVGSPEAVAAGIAILEEAWVMPKATPAFDDMDWSIPYWISSWQNGAAKLATLEAKYLNNPAFLPNNPNYNRVVRIAIATKFYPSGKLDAAGATAYLAAHPFDVASMGDAEYSVTAQIKQAGGDFVGAKADFLECFRALKRGGSPDEAIAAFQAIDNETMFKDAAEQTAFYNLLLRIVPATEGNAKFLGLVKSQIEAMK